MKFYPEFVFFIFLCVYDLKLHSKFWSDQVLFTESKACTACFAFTDATPLALHGVLILTASGFKPGFGTSVAFSCRLVDLALPVSLLSASPTAIAFHYESAVLWQITRTNLQLYVMIHKTVQEQIIVLLGMRTSSPPLFEKNQRSPYIHMEPSFRVAAGIIFCEIIYAINTILLIACVTSSFW